MSILNSTNVLDALTLLSAICSIASVLGAIAELLFAKSRSRKITGVCLLVVFFIISGFSYFYFSSRSNTIKERQALYDAVTNRLPDKVYSLNKPQDIWDEGQLHGRDGSCLLKQDGLYHVSMTKQDHFYPCWANVHFQNFICQVEIQFIRGDAGGILFRADITNSPSRYYYFYVANNGSYQLAYWPNDNGKSDAVPLLNGTSQTFYDDQINHRMSRIAVAAEGNNLYLYIDGSYVDGVQDSHLTSGGQIALIATKAFNDTEIAYSQVQIWLLP